MADTEIEDKQLILVPAMDVNQSICSNCKAPLNGPYCAQCGQNSELTIKYFWLVILHLLDDIFSFDSRASRTLWPLVTRPGFLTNEYILGRRVHYVPPLRLYFFISIIFFITLQFFAVSENSNFININKSFNADTVSKVTTYISKLEQQRDLLLIEENQDQSKALLLVKQDLEKFTLYETYLSSESNKILKAITGELVMLDLRRFNSRQPLNAAEQEQYNNLTQQLVKVSNGEKVNLFSIGNSSDGTVSLPFLTAKQNVILNDIAMQLEEKASNSLQGDTGPLVEQVINKLPQLMFVLLPLFAALLKLTYFFSKRLYMEHLTVALHSHSFVFVIMLLLQLTEMLQNQIPNNWQWANTSLNIASNCLLAWIPIYLFILQKRVYKQGYVLTAVKYTVVGIVYTVFISVTGLAAFFWGLMNI